MKKLLLSALAVAACASVSATDYTVDFKNATDIQGTFVEETLKDDGSLKAAPHYQPLTSLKCADFVFTASVGSGSTEPAFYLTPSTNANTLPTLRVYVGNTLTIAAPAGVKMGSIAFTLAKGVKDATVGASAGSVFDVTTAAMKWTNADPVETLTLTFPGTFQIKSMVVSTEGGEAPVLPTFTKVTTLVTGKYVIAVDQEGTVKVAGPEDASKNYGRMLLSNANISGDVITTAETNAFDFTVADGKVTIQDPDGRYYGMDNSHLTSFQFYTEVNEGCYWTYSFEGDKVKLVNDLNIECFVAQSKGTNGTWYTNVAPAEAPTEFNLPMLFAQNAAGVETVVVENANAPVEYYNLQGVRVADPSNGIFIRRQGSKVTKVAL